jgi:recombination protein RecT
MENVPAIIDDKSEIRQIVDRTHYRTREMLSGGEIVIPADYNMANAFKSAQLLFYDMNVSQYNKQTKSYEEKNILEACTPASVSNALLKMVVMGLNPAKRQIDFIPYGNKLIAQPSYFGDMAMTKRFCGAVDIITRLIYKDDDFVFEYYDEDIKITKHKSELKNWRDDLIIGAYTIIVFQDRKHVEIQTIDKIKKAWVEKSKQYMKDGKPNPKSVHEKFTSEMVKRSMVRYACKTFLNSSGDYNHILQTTSNIEMSNNNTASTQQKEITFDDEKQPEQHRKVIEMPDKKQPEKKAQVTKSETQVKLEEAAKPFEDNNQFFAEL